MRKRKGSLLTIGSFDGVHVGHRALLDRTIEEARRRRLKSVALTFNVPPRMILNRSEPVSVLSTPVEKEILLKSCGIQKVVLLDFNRNFSKIKPYNFFRDILLKKFNAKGIVVGMDFRFGTDRSAGVVELVRWGQEVRIPIWVLPQVKVKGTVVSSSVIRELLKNNFSQAIKFLGHPYLINGPIVKGGGQGKKLGFPTTNIRPSLGKVVPQGVFVVKGMIDGTKTKKLRGVCNIGHRPTIYKKSPLVIEPHWFSYPFRNAPKSISIELLEKLRPEKKFISIQGLNKAISSDVSRARRYFSKSSNHR